MSYIRANSIFYYVEGKSKDYIFESDAGNGKTFVEDYGGIKDETLVELIARRLEEDKYGFEKYLIKKLAERLNVKLRSKPLTLDEAFNLELRGEK